MTDIAIMGLGLMGGSLGLALKRIPGAYRVHGYTRSAERGRLALERRAVDVMHPTPGGAVRDADIVVLCAPILAIPAQLESVRSDLKPGAVVTDVGSTKAEVQAACSGLLAGRQAAFVGSHPIAGSEQQGMEAAMADLYDRALVVITPGEDALEAVVSAVHQLWADAGARVLRMGPDEHDRALALTSHVPHMVAAILAATVGRHGVREDIATFCGTGFLDTTRVAEGGVDIWMDIVRSNRQALITELKAFGDRTNHFIEKLEQGDFPAIERTLEEGRAFRKTFN